jgi:aryl carrier-like protein
MELLKTGTIKPIDPIKVFEAREIQGAMRYMQKGVHIGKVLVQMPCASKDLSSTISSKKLQFNPKKSYLLVGGLGGLGKAVSIWMVESGARHFIYLSPSAGSEKHGTFIKELEMQDCTVTTISGSVSSFQDVQNAVVSATYPIGGVLQMSMNLRDALFSEQTYADWNTVCAPKIQGTWNLHNALSSSLDLDFFVLFSSISGIIGTRGQAAYAAANTFLDSFVSYRHSSGLPASCIDIGVMSDIGYLKDQADLRELLKMQDIQPLRETDLLQALQFSIANSFPDIAERQSPRKIAKQLGVGLESSRTMSDPLNRVPWKYDRRTAIYHNVTTSETPDQLPSSASSLRTFMATIESDPTLLDKPSSSEFLLELIGTQIYLFMMRPVEELDVDQSLSGLGVDSLVTIEIRNWWRRSFGFEANTLEILGAGTIKGLANLAIDGLRKKLVLKQD